MAVASKMRGAGTGNPAVSASARQTRAISAISCVIVAILGLQTVASFVTTGRWGWPFIAYPMYKTPHFENERVLYDFEVYATHDDGSEALISQGDLPFWTFKLKLVNGLANDDRDSVQPIVRAYCERTGTNVVAVRLQDMGVAVSRDGAVSGLPPQAIGTMSIGCQE